MKHINIMSILITGAIFCSAVQASAQVSAGGMTLTAEKDGAFTASTPLDAAFLQSARLRVYDGKNKSEITLTPTTIITQKESLLITYNQQSPLSIQLEFKPVGHCIVWQVTCKNGGNSQLWLEVGPELQIKSADKLTVFDGWDDYVNPQRILPPAEQEFPNGKIVFPVAAAWNDRVSVGVGIEPSQLVSYFGNSYKPQGARGGTLGCTVRIVVDAGKEQSVSFMTCVAPGEWGKYEIFETYYDSFPQWFVSYPGVDSRVSLGDSNQNAWPRRPGDTQEPWTQEISRRTFCGWSWCYSPFRRTGDITCRPDLWDYKFLYKPKNQYALPREQFLKWRKESFEFVKKSGLADLFYVDVVWCEDALAHRYYPDSVIKGPDASVLPGATSGCDLEINVFPLNTSFGRQYEKDTREVVKEINPSGIALDCAGNTWRYIGPVLPTLPARAWDDQVGVYCGVEVGVAKYMDFVHSLKRKDGTPLAMYPNVESGGPYAVFFRADATMLEGTPWAIERTHADRMRWKLGHKTLVWHAHYRLGELLDESTIKTPEQYKTILRGLGDFTLLQSLRLGAIPNSWMVSGNPKLMKWMPAMVECALTGWQPVPAARAPQPLWTSRYGKGLKTLIAIAHETASPVSGKIAVENSRLASGALLFTQYDGAALENDIVNGETLLPLSVPVRMPILVRAQLEILSPAAVTKGDVSEDMKISHGTLHAVLCGKGGTKVYARVPEGMRVAAVTWNGEGLKFTAEAGRVEFDINNTGRGTLEVQYRSTLFDLADSELLDYPFVMKAKPACTIIIPKNATEPEKLAAYRLQEYFRFWYGYVVQPNADVLIPIVESDSAVSGRTVNVRVVPGLAAGRITRKGDTLCVEAPDAKQLEAAMLEMLRALDRKYWTPGTLPHFPIVMRLGLAGKALE